MPIIDTPEYQQAFIRYLRRGTPLDISLKALADERPTTHYIWRTSGDSKVRASHAVNNGRIFAWNDPPETGHPGEDYNCRCWAEPYHGLTEVNLLDDPPIEPVYPEFLIIPLLRIPHLIGAWVAWLRVRNVSRNWRLGDYKSAKRWARQLDEGGWTPEKITNIIRHGKQHEALNRTRKDLPATRYQLGDEFVVVDNETKEIIQVSRPRTDGFIPRDF